MSNYTSIGYVGRTLYSNVLGAGAQTLYYSSCYSLGLYRYGLWLQSQYHSTQRKMNHWRKKIQIWQKRNFSKNIFVSVWRLLLNIIKWQFLLQVGILEFLPVNFEPAVVALYVRIIVQYLFLFWSSSPPSSCSWTRWNWPKICTKMHLQYMEHLNFYNKSNKVTWSKL